MERSLIKRLLVGFVGQGLCPMPTKFEKLACHGIPALNKSPTKFVVKSDVICRAWALSHADEI